MPDLAHDADAYRRLWLAVASAAVVAACTAIVKRKDPLEAAVAKEMRYFRSRSWRLICGYADITYAPDRVEQFLKPPYTRTTSAEMRRAMGLMEREA